MATAHADRLHELIARLDDAVSRISGSGCCQTVKEVLEDVVRSGDEFVPSALLQPAQGCYARRLLHKDPEGRYVALVMVWDKGQGTPIHDHDEKWCVECVYRGRIRVVPFNLQDCSGELAQFEPQPEIFAGPGEAGALIPPFEYHTLENAIDEPAVTIHIYEGELTKCHIFLPEEGGYRRVERQLSYTAD